MPPKTVAPAREPPHTDDLLFPAAEARIHGRLEVGDGHDLYWEESGPADGVPVIFLHGGPGAGSSPRHRRLFDPQVWRAVIFDQRGAGRSRPYAATHANSTQHLVADIERLREARGIERWVVFGGSWGSTLALAYAEAHPDRCLGLVLRGIFLGEPAEIDWFMQGLAMLSPQAWAEFSGFLPATERGDLLGSYLRRLNDPDPGVNGPAALAWSRYETLSSTLYDSPDLLDEMTSADKALAISRLEAHYFAHDCFLGPGQLIRDIGVLRRLPGVIVQGRYDILCPMSSAWRLAEAWPEAEFVVVPDAGHSAFEPSIARELIAAMERMRALVR